MIYSTKQSVLNASEPVDYLVFLNTNVGIGVELELCLDLNMLLEVLILNLK